MGFKPKVKRKKGGLDDTQTGAYSVILALRFHSGLLYLLVLAQRQPVCEQTQPALTLTGGFLDVLGIATEQLSAVLLNHKVLDRLTELVSAQGTDEVFAVVHNSLSFVKMV